MVDLNNPEALSTIDSTGYFAALAELGTQCRQAYALGRETRVPAVADLSTVVVTGLGGSAIGGDLLRVYCQARLRVPVTVNRDYTLPAFVGRKTLVFAVSYSGNTEETLSAYQQAREKGATIVALTSGGKLAALAGADGVPVIRVPAGLAPRAATGYLFIPMLAVLESLEMLDGVEAEVEELARELAHYATTYGLGSPVAQNPAKQLALNFKGRLPIIWGASGTTEVVAQRWKGQINENAKAPAYWNVFPELNHNEIVGFEEPAALIRQLWVVILRDKGDHVRVGYRMEITRRVIEGKVAGVTEVTSTGEGMLARLYSLIYLGDWASVYLATLYGIDPGPVRVIDYLKGELAKR
ncbi:bifunctional phosphoglucose/phosphomannose isomerase [Thermodesulfitimonas autotrophica]|uniref:bifunctional phosphoglucose/phosphomannose isomerase n=1 Tax=Thermodesulfitimonas autotrophica TaxID=1894989 RepID=UPI002FE1EDF4